MPRKPREGNGTVEESAVATLPEPVPEATAESPPEEREERGNYPVHVVRFGLVRACVWQVQTAQGPRHNVTVSRLYQGNDGAWHASTTFSYRDLLPLAKALDWAHSWIAQEIANSGGVPF